MFIFPLIFIVSFIATVREIYNGNKQGILVFLIFGLSIYTTAMSVAFLLGLKDVIPFMQFFKEILVLSLLAINIFTLNKRPRFHVLDYAIFAFLGYTCIYAILPIGEQSFPNRLVALKSISFYVLLYFTGRFMDVKKVYINRYFSYIILLTIAAGAVLLMEIVSDRQLQTQTGYAEYSYYFFNFEPGGHFGLSWTFESEGGYKRFASFFANPLEHAAATLLGLAVMIAMYTRDDNRLHITGTGLLAFFASILSILFAISRAPLASYFLIIYVYGHIIKNKYITKTAHTVVAVVVLYLAYLFTRFEKSQSGIIEVLMNTVDFSNPSSVGHLVEWVQGVIAIIDNPLGLGLGTSGRVGGTLGGSVGGENQFIIIGVQVGVLALLLYLYIYVMFIRTGLKWLTLLQGKDRKICMAVVLFKIGILIPLFTSEVESSSYISYMNWFLSGLMVSVIMQSRAEEVHVQAIPEYGY